MSEEHSYAFPITGRKIEALLKAPDSLLLKEYNAACTHLAALEQDQELQFFLKIMEAITKRKLTDLEFTYAKSRALQKQQETNHLLDAEYKKKLQPLAPSNTTSSSNHFLELTLTVVAYHLNHLNKAQTNIQAAQTAIININDQWHHARQTFITNVTAQLRNLATIHPALAKVGFNTESENIQVLIEELSRRRLPVELIEHQHLQHIKEAIEAEVLRQKTLLLKENEKENKTMSAEKLNILATQLAYEKTNRVAQCDMLDHIALAKVVRDNKPLVEQLCKIEIEKLIAKDQKGPESLAAEILQNEHRKRIMMNRAVNSFIKLLHQPQRINTKELNNKYIEAKEKLTFNMKKAHDAEASLKTKFADFEQLVDVPAFHDFLAKIKEQNLLNEEKIQQIFNCKP